MKFLIFLPVIYLLTGIIVGKLGLDFKALASKLILHYLIPVIIAYYVITGKEQVLIVTFVIGVMFIPIYFIITRFTKNPLLIIMHLIPNVGWTGLPIATVLFNHNGTIIFIGMFIASSLAINGLGDILFTQRSKSETLKGMIKVPSTYLFLISLLVLPFDIGDHIAHYFSIVFKALLVIVAFLGMFLMGQWIAITKLTFKQVIDDIPTYIYKTILFLLFMAIIYAFGVYFDINIIKDHPLVYILFALLPGTTGVITIETHYRGTGQSINKVTCSSIIGLTIVIIFALSVEYFHLSYI